MKKILIISMIIVLTGIFIYSEATNEIAILQSMQSRNYENTVKLIQENLEKLPRKDYFTYLMASALIRLNKLDEAAAVINDLMKKFPESEWSVKGKYQMAVIHFKKREFNKAYEIYNSQLSFILSKTRRKEFAKRYDALAKILAFNEDKSKRNYQSAVEYFGRAIEINAMDENEEENLQFNLGKAYYEWNRYSDAIREFEKFNKKFKTSSKMDESLIYLGLSYLKTYNQGEARKPFKTIIDKYSSSKLIVKALYYLAKTYNFENTSDLMDFEMAMRYLKMGFQKYQDVKFSPRCAYEAGTGYSRFPKYQDEAISTFFTYVKQYPKHKNAGNGLFAAGEIQVKTKKYDSAITTFRRFLTNYPNNENWQEAQKRIIYISYLRAKDEFDKKNYAQSSEMFGSFIKDYPLDINVFEAMYLKGLAEFEQKKYQDAVKQFEELFTRNSNQHYANVGMLKAAEIYLKNLEDYKKAIETLKKINYYSFRYQAQQLIALLEKPAINLSVKKLFLSGETPIVNMELRNIKSVKINVYKINLLDYFYKMQSLREVEKLDILLIQPNFSYEKKIDEFKKYKKYEIKYPVPMDEPGGYVVQAVSDKLTSTTLVLKSDIAIINHISRDSAVIYIKNLKTNRGQPDTEILLSDGSKIFAKGKTDSTGIFKFDLAKLAKNEGIRPEIINVFAKSGNHLSSNALSLSGLSTIDGSEFRSFIYGDKPVYQPGDTIHYKAVMRRIIDGKIVLLKQKVFNVKFHTPAGDMIYSQKLQATETGSISGTIILDSTVANGEGTLNIVSEDSEISFSKKFIIRKYELPKIQLKIDTERETYLPGETVKFKIEVTRSYGVPVPKETLNYSINNQSTKTIKTDRNGIARVAIDTSTLARQNFMFIRVIMSDGTAMIKYVHFKLNDFKMTLKATRNLYISEEEIPVEITTLSLTGKPIAKKIKIKVFPIEGGETIQNIDAETAAGKSSVKLKIVKGGRYRIEVTGIGKNGISLTESTEIEVAGKDDKRKIFILNDEIKVKAGAVFNIIAFSRAENDSAILLLTGEKTALIKEIDLNKGRNSIPIQIKGEYAPNMRISILLVNRKGSYSSVKDIEIEKQLKVQMTELRKKYSPGETVNFSVHLTDISGKKVNGEVSVAVVDETVFDANKVKLEKISRYFYKERNLNLFRNSGSSPYKYQGITLARNAEVLRESTIREGDASEAIARQGEDQMFNAPAAPAAPSSYAMGGAMSRRDEVRRRLFRASGRTEMAAREQAADRDISPAQAQTTTMPALLEQQTGETVLRNIFKETAFFKANVKVTDTANISFKLPDNITKWRIVVVALSGKDLFGTGIKKVTTGKNLYVQTNLPPQLMQGDKIKISANVVNTESNETTIPYSLTINTDREYQSSGKVKVEGYSSENIVSREFIEINGPGDITVEARAGNDRERRKIKAEQWAQKYIAGVSGYTNKTIVRFIKIPDGFTEKTLIFRTYPHNWKILEKLKSSHNFFNRAFLSQLSGSLMTDLSLYEVIKAGSSENDGRVNELSIEIQRKVYVLLALMNNNGSYGWIKMRHYMTDVNTTVFNYYALTRAKKAGFQIDAIKLDKIKNYLYSAYNMSSNLEIKTFIIWALSNGGKVDYSYINRLYRSRSSLSVRGLALLTLTLVADNRQTEADQIITGLSNKHKDNKWSISTPGLDYFSTDEEVTSLVILSFLKAKKETALAGRAIRRMLVEIDRVDRPADLFKPLFSEAYAFYIRNTQISTSAFTLRLKVNGKTVVTKRFENGVTHFKQEILSEHLTNNNRLDIEIDGQGELSYSALIQYSKPGFVSENVRTYGQIKKYYLYPKFTIDGNNVDRGFNSVYGEFNQAEQMQTVKSVAKGMSFPVVLQLRLKKFNENYFILRDYIPAGCRLSPNSATGDFEHYEQEGNEIVFYIRKKSYGYLTINYELTGAHEGEFRALPPRMFPVLNPNKEVIGKSMKIEIKPADYATFDKYRFTPDELYNISKNLYENKKFSEAGKLLKEYIDKYNLREFYYKEAVQMLLFIALKADNERDIVKYFDLLRDKNPDLELELKDVKKIAESYAKIGEHERAFLLIRDIMQAYFSQENQLGGILVKSDKLDESLKVMKTLFRSYPDTDTLKSMYYSYGQELYRVFTSLPEHERYKKKGMKLYKEARDIFVEFLTEYPDYENADEVSFTFLNLILQEKRYPDLYNAASLFSKRYEKSKFTADYKYLSAYALFQMGRFDEAKELAKEVAEKKFPSPDGILKFSENRFFAIHMLAKIYDALGQSELALQEYRKVASHFSDARNAIEFLKTKNVSLPEVRRFKPGEQVKLEMRSKGVDKVEMKIYKVDFVILCLSRDDLSNIRNVNLTGIAPEVSRTISVSGNSETVIQTNVEIPVRNKGAYLIVLKSGEIETSGIVLISEVNMEAQSYSDGRIRVQVRDANGKKMNEVKIFMRGSYARNVVRTKTDIRGIAEGDNVRGIPFVFGEINGHYIFYKGLKPIGIAASNDNSAAPSAGEQRPNVLRNIMERQMQIQTQQSQQFDTNVNRRIERYKIRDLMR